MTDSAFPEFDQGAFLLHRNKGHEHFEAEEYALARRDLELALSIRDDDPDVMYWLAMTYFRLDQHEEAEILFRRLMTFRPGHATLHVNRGIALFKLDRHDEAEKEFRQALELEGGGNRPHLYLGLTHARRAEYETALQHFDQAGAGMLAAQMRQRLGLQVAETDAIAALPALESAAPATAASVSEPPEEDDPPSAAGVFIENEPRISMEVPQDTHVEVAIHGGSLLQMTFRGVVLVHRGTLVGSAGLTECEPTERHGNLVRIVGDGSIYLTRPERRVSVVPLRGETFYLLAERFVACGGESARIEAPPDTHSAVARRAIGLCGEGMVGMSTLGRPLTVQVRPERPAALALGGVVGWMGSLKVQTMTDGPAALSEDPWLRFEGSGKVILDIPDCPTEPDQGGSSSSSSA